MSGDGAIQHQFFSVYQRTLAPDAPAIAEMARSDALPHMFAPEQHTFHRQKFALMGQIDLKPAFERTLIK